MVSRKQLGPPGSAVAEHGGQEDKDLAWRQG
jgi:hypothetical protein